MRLAPAGLLLWLALPGAALAETPDETETSLFSHRLALEYRVQHVAIRPLSLNDLSAREVGYFDQRGRADLHFFIGKHVNVRIMTDLLDGVLLGDNGSFVEAPFRNRGAIAAAKSPNLSRLTIGILDERGNTLDLDNYGLLLAPADPVVIRMLYGEALLPMGLLRAGRQPLTTGRSVLVHEGTRINRWGVSRQPDTADAIAFGTKLTAMADFFLDRPIDRSADHGLFLGTMFGQVVENLPQEDDDVLQLAATVFYKGRDLYLLGLTIPKLDAGAIYIHRFGPFDTALHSATGYLIVEAGRWVFSAFHAQMFGETREVSEALSKLGTASGAPQLQDIRAFGGFAELTYRLAPFEFAFEVFYASGDDTPASDQPITQLTLAEDTNVGLHLFENIVRYQTGRAAARGVTNLQALGATSFPVAEIDTRGGLQNAIALFPQISLAALSWLDVRAGVLFAFTERPAVDPVGTILAATGPSIEDDTINFAGGPPGDYWGTEFDLGFTVKPVDGLLIDVEGAYLIPGDALGDENGDAVDSIFGNLRLTYFYDG